MDGFKKQVENSIQLRLSVWLSLAIFSVAFIAGLIAFFSAFDEAHELQDDMLRQIAALSDRQHWTALSNGITGTTGDSGKKADEEGDRESRVFVQWLAPAPAADQASTTDKPSLALPQTLRNGMQTFSNGHATYRLLVRTFSTGERLAVAQETAVRDEIASNSALRTLTPFLILVPILLLLVAHLVRKIFKPVADLAIELDLRDEQALHPISHASSPREIRPFVAAINRLLTRVGQSMDAQRRFVADAAHELRSPLTALSLQAERLAEADMSPNAQERLHALRQGIERGKTLLAQLLTLARAQTAAPTLDTPVSVQKVYRRVLEDLMPLAQVKQLDIGVLNDVDAEVMINELDLIILVKNLVDNAIRYTPEGGRVDLSIACTEGAIMLMVADSGPGIPVAERERVFDPFYRVLGSDQMGSGLGLSIVQTIAGRVGAKVQLDFSDEQSASGLRVSVIFAVP